MPTAFVHEALLSLEAGTDERAPGAAITVALCGEVDHAPPCPLAPHHNAASHTTEGFIVRTLFVAEPDREADVRARIDGALRSGDGEDGPSQAGAWHVRSSHPSPINADEREVAHRLSSAGRT